MSRRQPVQQPVFDATFVDGPAGRLFVVRHFPPAECTVRAQVLLIGPFAEEMNRARAAMAACARALAGGGIGVHVADLSGTGDSDGAFAGATWAGWLRDLGVLRQRCVASRQAPLWLAGIRTGVLLAAASLQRTPAKVERLLCIQPVSKGETFLNQLLRVRVAAAMARGTRETAKGLRARLDAGEPLNVAGYTLGPELAAGLAHARLADMPPAPTLPVDWYEIADERAATAPGGPPEEWPRAALRVRSVPGEPFWQLQIPTVPDHLTEALRHDFAAAAP